MGFVPYTPDDHYLNIPEDFNKLHVTLQVRLEVIQSGVHVKDGERAICVVFHLSTILQ